MMLRDPMALEEIAIDVAADLNGQVIKSESASESSGRVKVGDRSPGRTRLCDETFSYYSAKFSWEHARSVRKQIALD